MLKPTANYRMSKSLKTSLALSQMQDPHLKGQWKRAMIQAELYGALAPKKEKREYKGTNTPLTDVVADAE
jgi:hypothetical protein